MSAPTKKSHAASLTQWLPSRQNGGDLKEDEKTIETASLALVATALNPEFDHRSGLFEGIIYCLRLAGHVKDPVRAEWLWRLSRELVGEKNGI
jgi:hypothetical protein